MTVQDLKVHLAEVVKNKGTIHLYEKIVHVDFGDCLLLLQTFLHSDCYGSRGNLCVHGIVSLFKWNGRNLGKFDNVLESKFGGKYVEMNVVHVLPYQIKDICPLCFQNVSGQSRLQHNKDCKAPNLKTVGYKSKNQVSTYNYLYVLICVNKNCNFF